MRLVIVRHGEAEAFAGSATDAARQLTDKGRNDVERVGEWLAERDLAIQHIIASPYVRAQQTAAMLATKLGYDSALKTEPRLQPNANPNAVVQFAATFESDAILLVSHQPLVGRLLNLLVDKDDLPVFMPACCAVIEADVVAAGCAVLVSFTYPDDV